MNDTYPSITTTRIFRGRYLVTTVARNNSVVACHVLGAANFMMGGRTSHILVNRELPLNVGDQQCASSKRRNLL